MKPENTNLLALESKDARIKELEEALGESLALNINVFSDAETETCSYYSEHKSVIKRAKEALGKDQS